MSRPGEFKATEGTLTRVALVVNISGAALNIPGAIAGNGISLFALGICVACAVLVGARIVGVGR